MGSEISAHTADRISDLIMIEIDKEIAAEDQIEGFRPGFDQLIQNIMNTKTQILAQ